MCICREQPLAPVLFATATKPLCSSPLCGPPTLSPSPLTRYVSPLCVPPQAEKDVEEANLNKDADKWQGRLRDDSIRVLRKIESKMEKEHAVVAEYDDISFV